MRECDRCGKKIGYGALCDYCRGHVEGYSDGIRAGIKQGRAEAIDEFMDKLPYSALVRISTLKRIAEELKEQNNDNL